MSESTIWRAAVILVAALPGCVPVEGAEGAGGAAARRPRDTVSLVKARFGSGETWQDVTEKAIAAAVLNEDGTVSLPAAGETFGFPGTPSGRVLIATFEFRDHRVRLLAGEPSVLGLSADSLLAAHVLAASASPAQAAPAAYEIASAWYGAGDVWADVTQAFPANAKLLEATGVLSVSAANSVFGDPIVGRNKQLVAVRGTR